MSELPGIDLEAALRDLDRATKSFAERLGAAAPARQQPQPSHLSPPPSPPTPDPPPAPKPLPADAECEAREYLAGAKQRVDSLVDSLLAAVEREAATMRAEAEDEIRARREAADADAERRVEEAREVADRMVAERQRQIAEASDGLAERARALAAGMADAERIGAQFDAFVRALSAAAARIAAEDGDPPARIGQEPARAGSLAA